MRVAHLVDPAVEEVVEEIVVAAEPHTLIMLLHFSFLTDHSETSSESSLPICTVSLVSEAYSTLLSLMVPVDHVMGLPVLLTFLIANSNAGSPASPERVRLSILQTHSPITTHLLYHVVPYRSIRPSWPS